VVPSCVAQSAQLVARDAHWNTILARTRSEHDQQRVQWGVDLDSAVAAQRAACDAEHASAMEQERESWSRQQQQAVALADARAAEDRRALIERHEVSAVLPPLPCLVLGRCRNGC
jgi:uncharacterized protein YaiL (DUF2058 family)